MSSQSQQSQQDKDLYERISFKKCVVINHQSTIFELLHNSPKQILQQPTIKRCIQMHYKDQRQKIFNFLATVVFMKIGTKIAHLNRNLALSAPRNWRSVVFKYLLMPYVYSTYEYAKDTRRTILQIYNQIQQDTNADEVWQPIFMKKYPDLSQILYSSPFRTFKIQDLLKQQTQISKI